MNDLILTDSMSPWDLAFYHSSSGKIFIDKKVFSSGDIKLMEYISKHELHHAITKEKLDVKEELGLPFNIFISGLKIKPLWCLSAFIPYSWAYDKKGNKYHGFDILRLITMCIFLGAIIVAGIYG